MCSMFVRFSLFIALNVWNCASCRKLGDNKGTEDPLSWSSQVRDPLLELTSKKSDNLVFHSEAKTVIFMLNSLKVFG